MIYTLFIWTVVACGDIRLGCKYDWRPNGEFISINEVNGRTDAKAMCEDAGRQMGMKVENYRCIRTK